MKCGFCLEELNEGASVCRGCGRKQLLSAELRKKYLGCLAMALAAVAIVAGGGYWIYDTISDANEIDHLSLCANFYGRREVTSSYVRKSVEQFQDSGMSRRDAKETVALLIGCRS